MTIVAANTLKAFKNAGIDDDLAEKAAEEVAARYDDIADLKSDMRLVKWMLTFVLGMVGTLLFKAFHG